MQRLSKSYTKAINKRYDRVGPLFQGQFQALLVDCSEHLLHLSRYLHLNPVVTGLVGKPEDWEFSGYRDYIGLRRGTLPTPGIVLSQFEGSDAYVEFVQEYTPGDKEGIAHLLYDDEG